jgi:hypothetical protein
VNPLALAPQHLGQLAGRRRVCWIVEELLVLFAFAGVAFSGLVAGTLAIFVDRPRMPQGPFEELREVMRHTPLSEIQAAAEGETVKIEGTLVGREGTHVLLDDGTGKAMLDIGDSARVVLAPRFTCTAGARVTAVGTARWGEARGGYRDGARYLRVVAEPTLWIAGR